jgi:hypothetical protein
MDAKNVYDGIGRLVEASSARELPKPVNNGEANSIAENGEVPKMDNRETPDAKESEAINTESEVIKTESESINNESEAINTDEANKSSTSPTGQEDTNLEKTDE